jgi:hypothetical protein
MLKSLRRCGALVICGSALALVAAALPAQAATTGWRAAATVAVKGRQVLVSGINAVSAKDAWAVGAAATSSGSKLTTVVEHWTGKAWKPVALPAKVAKAASTAQFLSSTITASSSTNVWVFGELPLASGAENYLHFNGKTWTTGTVPGTSSSAGQFAVVGAAKAVGNSGVWAFGAKLKATSTAETMTPMAIEYNGHSWSSKSVPGSGEIVAASAISASNIWAVVGTSDIEGSPVASKPSVLHWNGTSWAAAAQPKLPAGASLGAITTGPGDTVWVAGAVAKGSATKAQFVDKLTGSSWAAPADLKDSASSSACEQGSLAPDGHGGLWTLGLCLDKGTFELWHFTGGKSSAPSSPKFGASKAAVLQLAAVPGTSSVWAAGAVLIKKATDGLIGVYGPTPR